MPSLRYCKRHGHLSSACGWGLPGALFPGYCCYKGMQEAECGRPLDSTLDTAPREARRVVVKRTQNFRSGSLVGCTFLLVAMVVAMASPSPCNIGRLLVLASAGLMAISRR